MFWKPGCLYEASHIIQVIIIYLLANVGAISVRMIHHMVSMNGKAAGLHNISLT
jgi:hypothetical protein